MLSISIVEILPRLTDDPLPKSAPIALDDDVDDGYVLTSGWRLGPKRSNSMSEEMGMMGLMCPGLANKSPRLSLAFSLYTVSPTLLPRGMTFGRCTKNHLRAVPDLRTCGERGM